METKDEIEEALEELGFKKKNADYKTALINFQISHAIRGDGIAGPETIQLLEKLLADKAAPKAKAVAATKVEEKKRSTKK